MDYEISSILLAGNSQCQDVFKVYPDGAGCLVVLCDGAGGSNGGLLVADQIVREFGQIGSELCSIEDFKREVQYADRRSVMGESTVVALRLSKERIIGASVGDSEAAVYRNGHLYFLTEHQQVKPLMGSGHVRPVGFKSPPLDGMLLIGSDGFWKYVNRLSLLEKLREVDFLVAAKELSDLARMKSGGLQDDLSLIVIREREARPARKIYALDE